jgi:hypothetical protein
MKFRPSELFLGCFLTIAVFATGMLFASSGHAPQSASEAIGSNWLTKDASGFFAGLQFFVATIQAALFIYQLHLIRVSLDDAKTTSSAATRQARVAEDTLNKIERPYLFVFNISSLKLSDGKMKRALHWASHTLLQTMESSLPSLKICKSV